MANSWNSIINYFVHHKIDFFTSIFNFFMKCSKNYSLQHKSSSYINVCLFVANKKGERVWKPKVHFKKNMEFATNSLFAHC